VIYKNLTININACGRLAGMTYIRWWYD